MNLFNYDDRAVVITDRVSLDECVREKRLGIILAVEGHTLLEDNLHRLDMLYKLGIRCLSLTWNPKQALRRYRGQRQQGDWAAKGYKL